MNKEKIAIILTSKMIMADNIYSSQLKIKRKKPKFAK